MLAHSLLPYIRIACGGLASCGVSCETGHKNIPRLCKCWVPTRDKGESGENGSACVKSWSSRVSGEPSFSPVTFAHRGDGSAVQTEVAARDDSVEATRDDVFCRKVTTDFVKHCNISLPFSLVLQGATLSHHLRFPITFGQDPNSLEVA